MNSEYIDEILEFNIKDTLFINLLSTQVYISIILSQKCSKFILSNLNKFIKKKIDLKIKMDTIFK